MKEIGKLDRAQYSMNSDGLFIPITF